MTPPLIAILLDGLDAAHSAVVSGVKRYRDTHRLDWQIRIVSSAQLASIPTDTWWILRTAGQVGQLGDVTARYPVCTLLGQESSRNRTCTTFDELVFGHLAVQHLHERGIRAIGTVDIAVRDRFDERLEGCRETCQRLGLHYDHFIRPRGLSPDESDDRLIRWIRSQPQPLGLYAVIDGQGIWLRDMLVRRGIRIPDEVALVSTGDHTSTCIAREPELSSVAYPWGLMGEAAALHVHHQIQGAGPPPPQSLRPFRVAARDTTRPLRPNDPLVARAVTWLEQHLDSRRPLDELVRHLGVSDPTLCKRFRDALGTTPKQVHDRCRIDRAIDLLNDSHLPIAAIAKRCGFSTPTAFGVAFKRRRGCTPSQWREALG